MSFLIFGFFLSINFIIILIKYKRKMYIDATIETVLLSVVLSITSGSFDGMVVGSIASMFLSIYLSLFPIGNYKQNKKEQRKYIRI